MAGELGGLVVTLSADIAKFEQGLNKAEHIMKDFAGRMSRLTGGFFAGVAMEEFFRQTVESGKQLANLSESTGIAVEKLSAYEYAARMADVANEELTAGLRKLAVNLQEAIVDPAGKSAQAFQRLGIGQQFLRDNANDLGAVFERVSARYGHYADGAGKVAISNDLLGRSSINLIRAMNHLPESMEEARKSMAVVPESFAKASKEFDDTVKRIEISFSSLAANSKGFIAFLHGTEVVLKTVASAGITVAGAMDVMAIKLRAVFQDTAALAKFNFADITKIADQANKDILESQIRTGLKLKELWAEPIQPKVAKAGQKPELPLPDLNKVSEQFASLSQQLHKQVDEANVSLIHDERQRALARVWVTHDEWVEKINVLRNQGKIYAKEYQVLLDWIDLMTQRQLKAAQYATRTPVEKLAEQWSDATKQMREATANWMDDFSKRLTDLVMTGKGKFSDFVNSVIADMVRIQIQKNIAGVLNSGGSAALDAFASWFGGAHAAGGIAPAGKISLVGEQGPELFMPSVSGTIIPNSLLGPGGDTYNIDARGADPAAIQRLEQIIHRVNGSIEYRAVNAVLDSKLRGGRFGAAFA